MKNSINFTLIALVIAIAAVLTFLGHKYDITSMEKKLDRQEKEVVKLNQIINDQDKIHKIEIAYRKSTHVADSLLIIEAKRLKKEDSLSHVTTIKKLITKYKKYTDPELDQELNKRYEAAIADTTDFH